jgi:hypothetical protein
LIGCILTFIIIHSHIYNHTFSSFLVGFTLKTPEEIQKVKESIRLAEEEKARLRMEQRAQRLLEREARLEMQRKAKENAAMSNDNMEEIKRQARENSDVNRKVEQEVVDMVNKISEEAGVGAEL